MFGLEVDAGSYSWDSAQLQRFTQWVTRTDIDTLIMRAWDDERGLWYTGSSLFESFEDIRRSLSHMHIDVIPELMLYDYTDQYKQVINLFLTEYGSCCITLPDVAWSDRDNKIQGLLDSLRDHPGKLYARLRADTEVHGNSALVSLLDPIVDVWIPTVYNDMTMKAMYEQFPKVRATIVPSFNIRNVSPGYAANYRSFILSDSTYAQNSTALFENFRLLYRKEQLRMVSYPSNPKGAIINPLSVSQFQPGHSEFECGAFCVAILGRSTAPSIVNNYSAPNLMKFAQDEYRKFTGSEGPTNTSGLSYAAMHAILKDSNLRYWDIDTSLAPVFVKSYIIAALQHGYPVIASISEDTVTDLDLGTTPYWWGAKGGHYIILVGNHPDGNFFVIDPAAVERGDGNLQTPKKPLDWPRHYKLPSIEWATIVQMPWLPPIPSNTPTLWPPYQPDTTLPMQGVTVMLDPNTKQLLFVSNNQVVDRLDIKS